jgi:hypothetical protein
MNKITTKFVLIAGLGLFGPVHDERPFPSGTPVITFEENAEGAPPGVKEWFYPGDDYSYESVYSVRTHVSE